MYTWKGPLPGVGAQVSRKIRDLIKCGRTQVARERSLARMREKVSFHAPFLVGDIGALPAGILFTFHGHERTVLLLGRQRRGTTGSLVLQTETGGP